MAPYQSIHITGNLTMMKNSLNIKQLTLVIHLLLPPIRQICRKTGMHLLNIKQTVLVHLLDLVLQDKNADFNHETWLQSFMFNFRSGIAIQFS